MILNKKEWTHNDYQNFIEFLYEQQDTKYLNFHSNLIKDNNIIGIKIPILKNIAKEIAKGNYNSFIKQLEYNTYEEKTLHGLILGYIECPFDELLKLIDEFVVHNDNWATNDTTIANLKIFKKNLEQGLIIIKDYLKSDDEWKMRFALILLLDYYLSDKYIDYVLNIADNITSECYYVKMANAWLISICYIKYKYKTECFFKTTKIDNWTYNKSISKICDSYRITKEDKEKLKKMRK